MWLLILNYNITELLQYHFQTIFKATNKFILYYKNHSFEKKIKHNYL